MNNEKNNTNKTIPDNTMDNNQDYERIDKYEEEELKNIEEFDRSIDEYRKDLFQQLESFETIFLEKKEDIFSNLQKEIQNIFNEYDAKHFNSFVLYCGRIYEFIIYQIGWYILQDTMYQTKFVNKIPEIKGLQDIRKEIEGYFKKHIGNPLKNDLNNYQKEIMEKRNDIAHPDFFGQLRDVDKFEAEKVLKSLIDAIGFFCTKFKQITQTQNK